VDNQSAIKLEQNPELHKRSKHIHVRFHFTRGLVEDNKIKVTFTPSETQLADILTKPLLKSKFQEMRSLMNPTTSKEGEQKISNVAKTSNKHGILSNLSLMMTILFCIMTQCMTTAFSFENSQPVLWRPSTTPITAGHKRVLLRINLVNPCDILTKDVMHKNIAAAARAHCNEMYTKYFLHEMEKMCPREHRTNVLVRSRRFVISTLIRIIICTLAVSFGVGSAGLIISAVNTGSISQIQNQASIHDAKVKELQEKVNLNQKAIIELQNDFNSLLLRFEAHDKDYRELKAKQTGTSFAISYVTTRLLNGKAIIQETFRKWNKNEMHPPFFDYINFTLPCGSDYQANACSQIIGKLYLWISTYQSSTGL